MPHSDGKPFVLIPGNSRDLIRQELVQAFTAAGLAAGLVPYEACTPEALARDCALVPGRSRFSALPSLFLSVNFQGLDKHGDLYAMLAAKGIAVAVWCVDTPWNLISGLRHEFWKNIHLFVTDSSFIAGLQRHGARHVSHLPLAACPELFCRHAGGNGTAGGNAAVSGSGPQLVFVGRSAFPDKQRFFLGQSVPPRLLKKAEALLARGGRPDFFWWLTELGYDAGQLLLWPGGTARRISLGAEESALLWRGLCLQSAALCGLRVYGDDGWRSLLARHGEYPVELLPPVDYYTRLSAIYRQAPFSLNMTSLLLPAGLTQRHFDVWVSGGFCLTDASPGLDIFPAPLVSAVSFSTAADIPAMVDEYTRHPEEKARIARCWREHIAGEHSYARRVETIMRTVFS